MTSTPTTATAVTSAAPVPEQSAAALRAYDEAYTLAAADPVNPEHPSFLAATTDGYFRFAIPQSHGELRDLGFALRPGPSGVIEDGNHSEARLPRLRATGPDQSKKS